MTPEPMALFEFPPPALVRRTDPATSRQAAASQRTGAVAAILAAFANAPNGLCDSELEARCPGWYGPTIRTARSRLAKSGALVKTGEQRLSARGFDSEVYRLR